MTKKAVGRLVYHEGMMLCDVAWTVREYAALSGVLGFKKEHAGLNYKAGPRWYTITQLTVGEMRRWPTLMIAELLGDKMTNSIVTKLNRRTK